VDGSSFDSSLTSSFTISSLISSFTSSSFTSSFISSFGSSFGTSFGSSLCINLSTATVTLSCLDRSIAKFLSFSAASFGEVKLLIFFIYFKKVLSMVHFNIE